MRRLFVIQPAEGFLDLVKTWFDSDSVQIVQAGSCADVLAQLDPEHTEVAIVDAREDATRAEEVVRGLETGAPTLPVIVLASEGPRQPWLDREGTNLFQVVPPPIDAEDFRVRAEAALRSAEGLSTGISSAAPPATARRQLIVGRSPAMRRLHAAVTRVAASDSCTVITGESGTGKSVVARCLHEQSSRRSRNFLTVDCSEPADTLNRELFGEPGTGSMTRLDQARGGTLFLRHLDRLPLALQDRLQTSLRSSRLIPPESSSPADVRIIASVTGGWERSVIAGLLREELARSLCAAQVEAPPLRERLEDLPVLAACFLEAFARGQSASAKSLSPVVSRVLAQYAWPGNVAELNRVLAQAAAAARSDEIQLGDLPGELLNSIGPSLLEGSSTVGDGRAAKNEEPPNLAALSRGLFEWARNDPHYRIIPAMERELIIHAMAETGGNQVQASKLLGITRATLRKRLKRLNIQREVFIY